MPKSFLIKKVNGLKQENKQCVKLVDVEFFKDKDTFLKRDELSDNFLNDARNTDVQTLSLIDRGSGNSEFEDDERIVVKNLAERSHEVVGFASTEASRHELNREKNCSLCDNLDDEFYVRSRTSEYAPVFIDSSLSYQNALRYTRDVHSVRELDQNGFQARERKRSLSPIIVDRYFGGRRDDHSSCSSDFIHHPLLLEAKHAQPSQLHLSSRNYCAKWTSELSRHDSLSPDALSMDGRHVQESCSPTQDEMLHAASKNEHHSTQYLAKSSCSSTPSVSPCSSTPGSSTSPMPKRLPSNSFHPTAPLPICFSKSTSACERYHNSYYSWSLHSSCFQRFPYYFPPSPVMQMHPKMKRTLSHGGVGIDPDSNADGTRRHSQKNTVKNYVSEPSSPLNAKVEINTDFESHIPKKLLTAESEANYEHTQKMPSSSDLQMDVSVGEKQGYLSLEKGQPVDENENILNDKIDASEGEEIVNMKSTKGRKFTCKFCGKIYVSLGALKMHIRTHTLPCKCHICGKAFSRPWLLQGHIRTHTGEKPYKCHLCQRAFADRSNLRAHLQTHSDVKKYRCSTCHKTFSRMSLLLKHEEVGCLAS